MIRHFFQGVKYVYEEKPYVDPDVDSVDEEERQQWSNPIEFLLSCIAMSVGLGSKLSFPNRVLHGIYDFDFGFFFPDVWRFPFTAYENGGGAFLIPYLIVLIFIGRPLYFLELAMGQFSSKSSVKVWDMSPFFRGTM